MPPKDVVWERGAHTEGKHRVLRNYLDAWFPILGSWNGRILFVDGFAGPGEYAGGEDGSPIIAIKALIEHSNRAVIRSEVVFMFIESDPDRATHLKNLVDGLRPALPAPSDATVIRGAFDESMNGVLDQLDEQRKRMAPAFVMIDPFGISGTPMAVARRILRNPRCELFISFMHENMNRFLSTPEFAPHLDDLFGTGEWRRALALNGEPRKQFLFDLYTTALRNAGAQHVIHFDLYDRERMVYSIFFATQHSRGCDRMKQAIWKIAPTGDYSFRGSRSDQLLLGVDEPGFAALESALLERFCGMGWVDISEVLEFVASDMVDYHTGQLKRFGLKPMELDGKLLVQDGSRKRKWTYPDGVKLQFLGAA